MSFGRRLALFFLLLVIVPTLALISILLFVSEDARRGKADARLAAGLGTAIALYDARATDGRSTARTLAATPGLGEAIAAGNRATLLAEAREEVALGAVAVEIDGAGGRELASSGQASAIAFGAVLLESGSEQLGTVRVSTTTASSYAEDVKRLTGRELIVSRGDAPLASTVTPPETLPENGETADLELSEGEYRTRRELLDPASGESILLLGPRKDGGALAIGRPAAALLGVFLLLAGLFAFILARRLTLLHEGVAGEAVTDPLTGLWNRRRMGELLAREEERQRRFGRPYSVLVMDVDGFKSVNDRHGHPQADAVLLRIADIIRDKKRTIDEAMRYGGDEFVLILSETGAAGAAVLAERLRSSVEHSAFQLRGGGELTVTVSIGVATAPECADEAEGLLRVADDAMLSAKRQGKNEVVNASAQT